MKILQLIFAFILLNSCTDEVEPKLGETVDDLTQTGIDVYDESTISTAKEPPENLLVGGDFQNHQDWTLCGDAQVVSDTSGANTENYLSLSTNSICEELSDLYTTVHSFVYHPISISQLPEKLYITLDARTNKEILSYTFDTNFKIGFLDQRFFSTDYYGSVDFINYFKSQLDESWSRIEIIAEKETIIGGLGEGFLPEYIFIELGANESMVLDIDNVAITTEAFTTQASPMPIELQNNLANEKFVFTNIDALNASIAEVNGSNMVNLPNVSTEVLSSFPTWYDNGTLLLAEKSFNPPASTNGTTIAAAQSELYRISFDGDKDLIYETLGHPGIYEYEGSGNNRDALDIEIDRAFWNQNLNLGLLTICGQNKGLAFVSDDYCKLIVIDEDGNEVATMGEEDTGFHGVWSSNSKIAYIWHESLHTAEIQGSQIIPSLVYTSRSDLLDAVEWSPNNNALAFIENGGKFMDFNGTQTYAYAIKILDLATDQKREVTIVDFGEIDPMLSWSNDGSYIFYSVRLPSGKKQIWWSEVATGDTGPITNTINAFAATVLK